MRRLYSGLLRLAVPGAVAVALWRGLRERAYWAGLPQRLGYGAPAAAPGALWLHAVSLGEVTAAAPLVRALRTRFADLPLVLTTATPTGRARALESFGTDIEVRYLPYDTPGATRRFLERLRPRLAVVMETELWPNLFRQCRLQGVPVVLASARLSARSVRRYRRLEALCREVFAAVAAIGAQTAEDAARFVAIGAAPGTVSVVGNLKFDVEPPADAAARGREWRSACGAERPVWIAGSSHAGEEEEVLEAHAALRAERADALLLLVPRHPQRFAAVADLLARRGCRFQRRSAAEPLRTGTEVLLVDSVGELAALYAAADVAFVGGSLVPVGGHNLLEPAALGIPVLTGPHTGNAPDVAALLLARGGALEVADGRALGAALRGLFADPAQMRRMAVAARASGAENRGALRRLCALIEPWAGGLPRAAR